MVFMSSQVYVEMVVCKVYAGKMLQYIIRIPCLAILIAVLQLNFTIYLISS